MSLDDAAQQIADDLQVPVLVFDVEMNVVAFSKHEANVDAARQRIILSRRGSARSKEMIAEHHVGRAHEPVFLPSFGAVPSRILVPLRNGDRLVGYLSCIADDDNPDLSAAQLELLNDAALTLGELVALRNLDERADHAHDHELVEALISASAEARSAAARLARDRGRFGQADSCTVLVLDSIQREWPIEAASRLVLEDACAQILRVCGGQAVGVVIPGSGLVVLSPLPIDRARLSRILDRPEFKSLISGEGSRRSLCDLFDSYREATIALQCLRLRGGSGSRSAVWSDLGLDRILVQLPLESIRPSDLPSALRILFDAPNSGGLIHTLDSYLAAGGDAHETAQRLLIHRSTLYYRLDKIRALTNVDLSDGIVRRELHTGLRVAELAGLWVAEEVPAHRS